MSDEHKSADHVRGLRVALIGPMSAGKSTIANLLSGRLGLPRLEMDELRWSYYAQAGYDEDIARKIYQEQGTLGILHYCKPFEAFAVESVILQHDRFVLDLGAGHSVHEDETLFQRVREALDPVPFVILLLPSADLDRSTRILNDRFSALLLQEVGEINPDLLVLNEHYVRHPANHRLAKQVFYTDHKTPDQTCGEIVELINSRQSD
ncbi:MAG: hypothetical protein P1P76_11275 [Anaerolineales bacterium]|nr:hypothetical protein [Anaerolineales bacterium]